MCFCQHALNELRSHSPNGGKYFYTDIDLPLIFHLFIYTTVELVGFYGWGFNAEGQSLLVVPKRSR